MIILGIDPGTTAIGYALLESKERAQKLLCADILSVRSSPLEDRLYDTNHELNRLISAWKPEILAIEKLFFAKNAKTALQVSEARGVILLTTFLAGLKVFECTPLEVKKTITGDGRADKAQIKKMLSLTLPQTRDMRARDDVFDAIAIALTCAFGEASPLRRNV